MYKITDIYARNLKSALQMNPVRLNFSQLPETPLLSLSHTDTHHTASSSTLDHRCRRISFDKCIANEYSETPLSNNPTILRHLHVIQTLTTLHLDQNLIGAGGGAQNLANALLVNAVRISFSKSRHFSAFFISTRHSLRLVLNGTTSAIKEHNILQVPCKRTQ